MSVFSWLKEKLLGRNGYVAEVQDAEIQEIKDESKLCLDKATDHLQQMQEEWTKLRRKEDASPEPNG